MAAELRDLTTRVPTCHSSSDNGLHDPASVRMQTDPRDNGVTISWPPTRRQIVVAGGAIAVAVLASAIFVFNVDLVSLAPFALVLVCPLMHLFMMRGMGHGGHQGGCHGSQQNSTPTTAQTKDTKA